MRAVRSGSASALAVALLLVLAAAPGCKRKYTTSDAPPTASPSAAASGSAQASHDLVMPAPGPPGFVYVRAGSGVAVVDPEGHVSTLKGPSGFIAALLRASDGVAYVLENESLTLRIYALDGVTAKLVSTLPECGLGIEPSFDARGDHLVVGCTSGIMERTGGAWASVSAPPEKAYGDMLRLGADNAIWYADSKGIYERAGGNWRKPAIEQDLVSVGVNLFSRPDGMYVVAAGRLIKVGTDASTVLHESKSTREVAPSSSGLLGFWGERHGLELVTSDGASKWASTKASLDGAHLDDGGRAWVATDGELGATDGEAGALTRVPMGAFKELDELSTSSLVVLGSGPKLPTPGAIRRTKKLRAQLLVDDKPLAGADVVLCPRHSWLYTTTPCSGVDARISFEAKTDAKGNFSVENLPMGNYYLHFKGAGAPKWGTDSSSLADKLKENGETNLGTLKYKAPAP